MPGNPLQFRLRTLLAATTLIALLLGWRLTQVSNPKSTVFQGRSHNSGIAVPDWWKPGKAPDIVYYLCPATLGGNKSDRYQVAFSESEQSVYVHYWYNF